MMTTKLQPILEATEIEGVMQNLRKVVKALEAYSRVVETRFGLTGPQLWVIWELGRHAPLALKDLAARMHMSPSTLVGVIDRLLAKGLVRREQDPEDRRRVCLSLSPEGLLLWAKAPDPAQGRLIQGLKEMPAKERSAFHHGLEHLVKAMDADQLEARFFFSEE